MTHPVPRWQPLLTGAYQQQAFAIVAEIAATLAQQPAHTPYSPDLALFFAYWAQMGEELQMTNDKRVEMTPHAAFGYAQRYLEGALERIANTPLGAGLYGGLAGTGWVLAHLAGWIYEADEDEPALIIDEVLYEHVSHIPWTGSYDLINGLVGIGVYAVARLAHPTGVQLLERVVEQLAALAEEKPTGITWHTPPQRLPEHQQRDFPNGYYNLGLSHGTPGVIALLGHAVAAGVALTTTSPLLDGAVRWLLAQEPAPSCHIEEEAGGGFAAFVDQRQPAHPARLAWCYGDVGIAVTLLSTARRVQKPAWEAAARRIARRAAHRPSAQTGVRDSCLCHGTAGLAHLFNRLYQATDEPFFAQQARDWLTQTFILRQPGRGVAGYSFWRNDQTWVDTPGFLEGAAGIGLALLAAIMPVEPKWDRLLLVDLPLVAVHEHSDTVSS